MQKPDNPRSDNQTPAKKPRGMGGVLLILALLSALFLVVAQSSTEPQATIYDFYRRLFEGRITALTFSDGTVQATYTEQGRQDAVMEVVLRDFARQDLEWIREVQALAPGMDGNSYASGGVGALLADLKADRITVKRAFFVNVVPGRLRPADPARNEPRAEPDSYVTAIVQRGNDPDRYVRVPTGGGATLQEARAALLAASVPVVDRSLSLDRSTFQVKEPNTPLIYLLGTITPYLLVILIIWFFILRQMRAPGGGSVLSFGRSRAALYTKENRTNVTFDDVAGIDEAKAEVQEIVDFLKNPARFAKLGGRIPRGVLLVGSPGTGKTLLAKAIAGEAEVPFFSISGSDFVEMFVGVGASRVRDLFKQARECSPCLVFLDEIDAVGRKRGSGMGGGHDEREQTLNAILVEMDGFDSDKGIILIGATNRPDVLDPALLRPGRFDRQITIDKPDVRGREQILKVHARRVKLAPAVDLAVIARATSGFSGADLAAVINESAILAAMKGKDWIETPDLEEARDRVAWGREKKSRAVAEEDRKVTAYHEAGHALVSTLVPGLDPVHKVTIISRGMALGLTMSLPERDDYNMRREKLKGVIAMCYGGRAAEEIVFGDISVGAQNDIEKATSLARMMVCELGMSDAVGPIRYTVEQPNEFLGRDFRLSGDISPGTLELIDREVRDILESAYERARRIMIEHRGELEVIAQGLLKYETLTGEEVSAVVRGDDLDDFRAARERAAQQAARAAEPRASEGVLPGRGELTGQEGLAPS